jgi:hypothetical protein
MKKNKFHQWGLMAICFSLILAAGCVSNKKLITSNGVHALKIGDAMPPIGTERLRGHTVRDTFVEQGEFQWREIVMSYRKGNVYLEEDFFGSESLNRVRIYTPELYLRNGLRVGMAVSDLQSKANDWTLVPIADHNLIEAYSRTMPRIHFLINDPAIPKTGNWEDYQLSQLAPDAKIAMIVVF